MPLVDVFGASRKNDVMADTWGHMYPEPGSKHRGHLVVSKGIYGDQVILDTVFPSLDCSPQRFHLEQTIFDLYDIGYGVYHVDCTLWFYKHCEDMFLGEAIGRIIKSKVKPLIVF